jgi:thioester reductase-like protein
MSAPTNQLIPVPESARFVTGGTGFIGRHLVSRLRDRSQAPVYVLVRFGQRPRVRSLESRRSRLIVEPSACGRQHAGSTDRFEGQCFDSHVAEFGLCEQLSHLFGSANRILVGRVLLS